MKRHGSVIAAIMGLSAGAAALAPLSLPGTVQPFAESLGLGQTVLSWCGVVFCALVVIFALASLIRPERAFCGLVTVSAVGASLCLGPLVAVAMSAAVLAVVPLLVRPADVAPAPSARRVAAPAGPPRPRRLFA